ncbi:hypothetical protein O1R50_18880 [Glycomyces luteolus]|uniref:Matrixin n=1 Tax=Glycomyces luteolus TaxID=2670330 RepID=A0A9X3PMX9_9ACTN|nr:hypothetical protein [Glycomyces luteolus]MDA1361700.1 hypothetical protein [Glycomyces luteolus]
MLTAFADKTAARIVGICTVVLVVLTASAGIAWAAYTDNMYPTQYANGGCISEEPNARQATCRTDNATLTYYMDSGGDFELETPDKDDVRATMSNDYNPTDLSVSYDSTPSFSGSAETDIIYQEGSADIPSSVDGMTWCNNASNLDECDQQFVRIRGAGYYSRGLACHETGHAVGLVHGSVSSPIKSNTDSRLGCMVTPVGTNTSLGDNNIENINNTY